MYIILDGMYAAVQSCGDMAKEKPVPIVRQQDTSAVAGSAAGFFVLGAVDPG
jgi:hypothetical protein